VYLLHSKEKWNASSLGTPQAQFGLDSIFDLYKSLFKKEAEHRSCVNITFNYHGPYMKCLGTIIISFAFFGNACLKFNGMSRYVVYLIKQLKFSSVTEINQAFKLYIQGVCISMYFIYYHATCRVNTDFYSLTDKPTNL
jgi:hypothetical protein